MSHSISPAPTASQAKTPAKAPEPAAQADGFVIDSWEAGTPRWNKEVCFEDHMDEVMSVSESCLPHTVESVIPLEPDVSDVDHTCDRIGTMPNFS